MTPSQGTSVVQRVASQPAKMADKDVAAADTASGMTAGSTAGKGKRKSKPRKKPAGAAQVKRATWDEHEEITLIHEWGKKQEAFNIMGAKPADLWKQIHGGLMSTEITRYVSPFVSIAAASASMVMCHHMFPLLQPQHASNIITDLVLYFHIPGGISSKPKTSLPICRASITRQTQSLDSQV